MKVMLISIVSSIAILVGVLLLRGETQAPRDYSVLSSRELALLCGKEAVGGLHTHPMIEIFANGQKIDVATNVGVSPTCMSALHTHTPDGVIHVESPDGRDFTLGDFFAVWKQPFSRNEVLTYKVDEANRIRVTVNGVEVDTFDNTVLRDGDKIAIYYEPVP